MAHLFVLKMSFWITVLIDFILPLSLLPHIFPL